jgi:hypothetical protein
LEQNLLDKISSSVASSSRLGNDRADGDTQTARVANYPQNVQTFGSYAAVQTNNQQQPVWYNQVNQGNSEYPQTGSSSSNANNIQSSQNTRYSSTPRPLDEIRGSTQGQAQRPSQNLNQGTQIVQRDEDEQKWTQRSTQYATPRTPQWTTTTGYQWSTQKASTQYNYNNNDDRRNDYFDRTSTPRSSQYDVDLGNKRDEKYEPSTTSRYQNSFNGIKNESTNGYRDSSKDQRPNYADFTYSDPNPVLSPVDNPTIIIEYPTENYEGKCKPIDLLQIENTNQTSPNFYSHNASAFTTARYQRPTFVIYFGSFRIKTKHSV